MQRVVNQVSRSFRIATARPHTLPRYTQVALVPPPAVNKINAYFPSVLAEDHKPGFTLIGERLLYVSGVEAKAVEKFTLESVKRKRKKKIKKHWYKKRMRRMKALMKRLGKIR